MSDELKAKYISEAETGVPLSSAKEAEEIYANSIAVEQPPQQGGDVGEALSACDVIEHILAMEMRTHKDHLCRNIKYIRAHLTQAQEQQTAVRDLAWSLYCEDTSGDMDVRDFWDELPSHVQAHYITKAEG